ASVVAIVDLIPLVVEDPHRVVDDGMLEEARRLIRPLEEKVDGLWVAETVVGPEAPHREEEVTAAAYAVHEEVGRLAAYVPFDRRGAAVDEELAALLLRGVLVLLRRGHGRDHFVESGLGRGFRTARSGEPGENGKKDPYANHPTTGHLYPFDHSDIRGERFASLKFAPSACQVKSPGSIPGNTGSSSSNSASSPGSTRSSRSAEAIFSNRERWSSVRLTAYGTTVPVRMMNAQSLAWARSSSRPAWASARLRNGLHESPPRASACIVSAA